MDHPTSDARRRLVIQSQRLSQLQWPMHTWRGQGRWSGSLWCHIDGPAPLPWPWLHAQGRPLQEADRGRSRLPCGHDREGTGQGLRRGRQHVFAGPGRHRALRELRDDAGPPPATARAGGPQLHHGGSGSGRWRLAIRSQAGRRHLGRGLAVDGAQERSYGVPAGLATHDQEGGGVSQHRAAGRRRNLRLRHSRQRRRHLRRRPALQDVSRLEEGSPGSPTRCRPARQDGTKQGSLLRLLRHADPAPRGRRAVGGLEHPHA